MSALRHHPSRRRLEAWLEHGDEAVGAHVATCERCAGLLEEASPPSPSFAGLLDLVLAPPPDLERRLQAGIARKLQTREDLRLLAEMFGVPIQTMRAVGPPAPEG